MAEPTEETGRWYSGISRYQWIVLLIASLGWVFDAFEGQIFVASMSEAMPSLTPEEDKKEIPLYNNVALGAFLAGGALGGVIFGMLGDRIGRKRTLSLTILFYSLFTFVSAFSQEWWHLAGLRFLVAMGVGGEWAVASALVSEVFPNKARAHVASIFHASSVFGTYLAVAIGTFIIGNTAVLAWSKESSPDWLHDFADPTSLPWRIGFAIGVLPALLILWVRRGLRDPDSWIAARARAVQNPTQRLGSVVDLFRRQHLKHTILGVALATSGLATFWGTHIYGKDLLEAAIVREQPAPEQLTPQAQEERDAFLKRWQMLGLFLTTTGGGFGLLLFGPISQLLGRRGAFLAYNLGGFVSSIVVFQLLTSSTALLVALPIFGFLTLGMHAGYAVYFPELYPTRLRGTGAGMCFNAGRLMASPILLLVGFLRSYWEYSLTEVATMLSFLFLAALLLLPFAPETRGRPLPE